MRPLLVHPNCCLERSHFFGKYLRTIYCRYRHYNELQTANELFVCGSYRFFVGNHKLFIRRMSQLGWVRCAARPEAEHCAGNKETGMNDENCGFDELVGSFGEHTNEFICISRSRYAQRMEPSTMRQRRQIQWVIFRSISLRLCIRPVSNPQYVVKITERDVNS